MKGPLERESFAKRTKHRGLGGKRSATKSLCDPQRKLWKTAARSVRDSSSGSPRRVETAASEGRAESFHHRFSFHPLTFV